MPVSRTEARRRQEAPSLTPLPEGTDGLFSQSWFPICLGADLTAGKIKAVNFLDGRVVVFRDRKGQAQVMSAYCPHMGASLEVGDLAGDELRCLFHQWRFDSSGTCTATGIGDTPPPRARLFKYPARERYGIVWAFNGEDPLFDLPDLKIPDDRLAMKSVHYPYRFPVDHWVFTANTPDVQHLTFVHDVTVTGDDPLRMFVWRDNGFTYGIAGTLHDGTPIDWTLGIYGTSVFVQQGLSGGVWHAVVAGFSCHKPGESEIYLSSITEKGDGSADSEAHIARILDGSIENMHRVTVEDKPIMDTMRFRPQYLTRADEQVGRYLAYLRDYPRAHPGADYIR